MFALGGRVGDAPTLRASGHHNGTAAHVPALQVAVGLRCVVERVGGRLDVH